MKSLDTNILYYAANMRSPEHEPARALVESIPRSPTEWILADQVLYEYYRLVRNPRVLERPLTAPEAARHLRVYREQLGCLHCGYDEQYFPEVASVLERPDFPASRTFNAVLAVTLRMNGVTTFYTRNVRDFTELGWFSVIDPIA